MIEQSFLVLPRFSRKREQSLWKQGINDWDEFLSVRKIIGIPEQKKGYFDRFLRECKRKLLEDDTSYFTQILPSSETWRLYNQFKNQAIFLDIEATGPTKNDFITVISLFDSTDTKTLVQGINLDPAIIRKEISKHKLLVTFNGKAFDIPLLEKLYPGITPTIPHLDLLTCCQRLNLTGGLKQVEQKLGIKRQNKIVEKMYNGDPLTLWRMFKATDDDYYLKLLIEYNEEDVINLKFIADRIIKQLERETFPQTIYAESF